MIKLILIVVFALSVLFLFVTVIQWAVKRISSRATEASGMPSYWAYLIFVSGISALISSIINLGILQMIIFISFSLGKGRTIDERGEKRSLQIILKLGQLFSLLALFIMLMRFIFHISWPRSIG